MRIAKSKHGYISALHANGEDGPFRCPECRSDVLLKKGDIYTHHFAHNPGEGCALGAFEEADHTGESALHRLAKKEIYQALARRKDITYLKLERFLGSVRPDISFYYRNIPIAIEMQVSTIRPDVIVRRTRDYTRRGISLLWVSPYGETGIREGHGHSTRDWERIIHSISGGTFYYWTQEEELLPVHFENARTNKSAQHLSSSLQIPLMGARLLITDLEPVSLPFLFTGETSYLEAKLWGIPQVWLDHEGQYVAIADAMKQDPLRYPQVRSIPPLEDPFRAAQAPSDLSLRGFVEEQCDELKPLFQLFYQKYGNSDLKLLWLSIDTTPNSTYFAPDWWDHFRHAYMQADPLTQARLKDMLHEKISGEKPNRH